MASQSRLRTALHDGLLPLPAGAVWLMRPAVGYDLGGLDAKGLHVLHTSAPEHAAWQSAGYNMEMPERAALAIVVVPRAKALARAMIAEACRMADTVVVDGAKTDGVDSLWTAVKKRLGKLPSVAKDHGRLFWFETTDAFADWAQDAPERADHGFYTLPGVFSDGKIDKGSAALVAALPEKLPKRIADFGAGWGYLSHHILQKDGVEALTLVEAEARALDCARLNITDPRAGFAWADATHFKSAEPLDAIIMNPPFHTGRAGTPELGQAFIAAAARAMHKHGQLWMVANRHLPYEAALDAAFNRVTELPKVPGFKIFHAQRPRA